MVRFRWEADFKESEIGMFKTKGTAHYIFAHGVCGKIPKDWKVKRINEDYNVNTGERVSPTSEGPFPVYGANGFSGYSNNFLIDKEAIITGRVGTLGQVYRVNGKSNISDNALYITKKKEEAVIDFLYYALKLIFDNIEEVLNVGTTQPLIKQSEVQKFSIPFPEYKEQFYVASVLSWIEDLIENKKRQNEVLEEVAMAVFKSWFVDFEPFKDGEFEPSELGEIPKGSKVGRLIDVSEIIMGQSPPSKYYNEDGEGLPFIQGKGQFGKYTPDTTIYCSSEGKIARPQDILVTVRAPVGELNIANGEYIIGRGVASLRSKHWSFIFSWLKQNNELIKAYERGTTFDAITKQELENFPILLPPAPILETYNSKTKPLFQKILLNQRQIMILKAIRDALLPLLVFGKLRVEEL